MTYLPDIFTFLTRHFGLVVKLFDPDGEEMEVCLCPLTEKSIAGLLVTEYRDALLWRLRDEQCRSMEVCIGGPLAGQSHNRAARVSSVFAFRERRAWWAAYCFHGTSDPRAWFCGYATSEKKAKELGWIALYRATEPADDRSRGV